jgi:hypothetical protein
MLVTSSQHGVAKVSFQNLQSLTLFKVNDLKFELTF